MGLLVGGGRSGAAESLGPGLCLGLLGRVVNDGAARSAAAGLAVTVAVAVTAAVPITAASPASSAASSITTWAALAAVGALSLGATFSLSTALATTLGPPLRKSIIETLDDSLGIDAKALRTLGLLLFGFILFYYAEAFGALGALAGFLVGGCGR